MSTKLTLLTVREAEKAEDSQLFILNRIKPRGNINITVNVDGERRTVTMPIAGCPFDVTTMTTKKSMLSSPEFRRLHARGFVQIVDTDSAENLFATNAKAREELNRIYDSLGSGSDLGADVNPVIPTENNVNIDNSTMTETDKVSPLIISVVARAKPDESPASLIQDMESQMDIIANDELQYIVAQSSNSDLKEWAALALLEREESEE